MEEIAVNIDNGVLALGFNRPDKKNAITGEMYAELADQLNAAADNDEVGAVLIYGEGDDFTAGNEQRNQTGIGNHTDSQGRIGIVFSGVRTGQRFQRTQSDALITKAYVAGSKDELTAAAAETGFLHMHDLADCRCIFRNDEHIADVQIFRNYETDLAVFKRGF